MTQPLFLDSTECATKVIRAPDICGCWRELFCFTPNHPLLGHILVFSRVFLLIYSNVLNSDKCTSGSFLVRCSISSYQRHPSSHYGQAKAVDDEQASVINAALSDFPYSSSQIKRSAAFVISHFILHSYSGYNGHPEQWRISPPQETAGHLGSHSPVRANRFELDQPVST